LHPDAANTGFYFSKPQKPLKEWSVLVKESSGTVKSEYQLRIFEPKDYVLMNPSGGGALSRTDQLKTIQDILKT
jgi:hypothetical protein